MSKLYEDRHVFAIFSPNMATAIMAINETETAHLLLHIVPHDSQDGYWLVYKNDSWAQQQWREKFPSVTVLNG